LFARLLFQRKWRGTSTRPSISFEVGLCAAPQVQNCFLCRFIPPLESGEHLGSLWVMLFCEQYPLLLIPYPPQLFWPLSFVDIPLLNTGSGIGGARMHPAAWTRDCPDPAHHINWLCFSSAPAFSCQSPCNNSFLVQAVGVEQRQCLQQHGQETVQTLLSAASSTCPRNFLRLIGEPLRWLLNDVTFSQPAHEWLATTVNSPEFPGAWLHALRGTYYLLTLCFTICSGSFVK
jgi:hypothetical protein